jgi:hypothetical protein
VTAVDGAEEEDADHGDADGVPDLLCSRARCVESAES